MRESRGVTELQRLTAGVAGVEMVPEIDVIFIFFPAKKNFLTLANRRKINQAAIQILELDFAVVKLKEDIFDFGHGSYPTIDEVSTLIAAGGQQGAEYLLVSLHFGAKLLDPLEPELDLRQQGAGLFTGVMLMETMGHLDMYTSTTALHSRKNGLLSPTLSSKGGEGKGTARL